MGRARQRRLRHAPPPAHRRPPPVAADAGADKAAAPSVAIGGQFKGDGADFKAKCSTNGNIAFSYAQKLNYFTKVTLGLGISPVDFSNNKFGMALTFSE